MDSFELNKIAGAVLGTLTFALGLNVIAEEFLFSAHEPEKPGYEIAVAEPGGEGAAEEAEAPIGVLLASADPAAGERAVAVCQACHTFDDGGAAKVGPNLHGVVGRAIAAVPGFTYSQPLQEIAAAGAGWDYDHLNDFLAGPQAYAPGTSMSFAGLTRPDQRANVIAYLASISPEAPPFPAPEAAEAPAEADAAAPEGATESAAPSPEAEEQSVDEEPAAGGDLGQGQDPVVGQPQTQPDTGQTQAGQGQEPPAPAGEAPASGAPANGTAPAEQQPAGQAPAQEAPAQGGAPTGQAPAAPQEGAAQEPAPQ